MQVDEPVLRVMERVTDDGSVVLIVQGEIDIATAGVLRRRLIDACERADDVTVDLRRVAFLDCIGLHLLLEQHEHCARHGRRIDLVQGPSAVRRVFELTGASERLSFVELGARRFASTG